MELNPNAIVLSEGGAEIVGQVDSVTLDSRTREVTHLVVRRSPMLREDKLLPIEVVARTGADRIVLCEKPGNLQDLPAFDETNFTRVGRHALMPRERFPA